jgi:arogenate/prephenate dehydratase
MCSSLQAKQSHASAAPVVAFHGMYGAYGEAAALQAVPGCEPLPCEHFETAFQAVLPIESTAHGSIHAVYDLLIR